MLIIVSLDFRRAHLEIRERFHLADSQVPDVIGALRCAGAEEVVIARTCNRLEAYCWWDNADDRSAKEISQDICRAWVRGDEAAAEEMHTFAQTRADSAAVSHLLRVASGLESLVLGDIHIIG